VKDRVAAVKPFALAPAPIMLSTFIVAIFYCLDALYGERRDRSVLFWKSLPVSDRTTVLAKASVPFVVLPLIAYVLSIAAQVILLTLSTPILLANGVGGLWSRVAFFEGLVIMAYGLTVHALWFAPIYGWLLLVSAWARRTPFLWAFLPVFAIRILERVAFHVAKAVDPSTTFQSVISWRVTGAMRVAFVPEANGSIDRLSQLTPLSFLSTPGLWLGLIAGAAFIALAIRLRRNREPI
jgi:ABC-2 type transport system permease protein